MKKMLSAVVGAALLAVATLGVANAQGKANGPFADVPTDHWAYQSVEKLRDAGIVIGYPDGTYGGRRAMTRYEFATAIARLLQAIPPPTDLSNYATKDDLKNLQPPIDTTQFAKQSDLDALRAAVTSRLSDDEAAIAALRDLVNEFAPELKQLGVDVAAANARIDALDKRVTALEEEVRRVKITGALNVIARADVNTKSNTAPAIDENGYGIGTKGSTSLWNQPEVYQDFLLTIDGRVNDTTHAIVSIDAGNYIPWLGSSSADAPSPLHQTGGIAGFAPTETFNIYQAYLTTPVSLGAVGATFDVGRFGTQFTPLTLKALDPDVYTYLTQTSSGDVITDGLKAIVTVSSVKVTAFAGNPDQGIYAISASPTSTSVDGGHLPGYKSGGGNEFGDSGANLVRNLAGARASFGNPDSWEIGISGVVGRNDATYADGFSGKPANNFGVYSVDGNIVLPAGLTAEGEFALDTTGYDSLQGSDNSTKGNEAWWGGVGYVTGALSIKADYKDVYTYFGSPGYWGSIGSWINPTNIEGPELTAKYAFSPDLSLNLDGDYYQGQYTVTGYSPLQKNDKVYRIQGGLKYGLTADTSVDLGYEWVDWNLAKDAAIGVAKGNPNQQFITLGVGHDLSKNTAVKLLYQIDTYTGDNTNFYPGVNNAAGGVLVGQASVKF